MAGIDLQVGMALNSFSQVAIISPYYERPRLLPQQIAAANLTVRHSKQPGVLSNTKFLLQDDYFSPSLSSIVVFGNTDGFGDNKSKDHQASLKIQEKWKKYLLDPSSPVDVDSISETIEYIYDQISTNGPESIDLNGLDAHKVNGEHLAAILRASSMWKNSVSGWSAAITVSFDALVLAEEDPLDALAGLI